MPAIETEALVYFGRLEKNHNLRVDFYGDQDSHY